jgi:NADP-dependent aldehyde dehydrogenase
MATAELREEVFGPAYLVVLTDLVAQAIEVLHAVGGSLTVTLWGLDADHEENHALVRAAMEVPGRALFADVSIGWSILSGRSRCSTKA